MTTLEAGQTAQVRKPGVRFMLAHPAHFLALGFGSGLSRIMPGTSGTLLAWLSYHVLTTRWPSVLTSLHWLYLVAGGFVIGVWACGKTGRDMGVPDHGSMVWDEIIAFWLVLAFLTPAGFATQLWAFIWFRFFDMVKPPPIAWFDRRFKGGFGV
ncbi:MAG: phosphatidylglycerophosphatase A family protein, partial [Janthinobacterium lividum]